MTSYFRCPNNRPLRLHGRNKTPNIRLFVLDTRAVTSENFSETARKTFFFFLSVPVGRKLERDFGGSLNIVEPNSGVGALNGRLGNEWMRRVTGNFGTGYPCISTNGALRRAGDDLDETPPALPYVRTARVPLFKIVFLFFGVSKSNAYDFSYAFRQYVYIVYHTNGPRAFYRSR